MRQAWLRTRRYFWIAAGLFCAGLVFGILLPRLAPEATGDVLALIARKFAPLLERMGRTGPAGSVLIILLNNLVAAAITIILGPTMFFPFMATFGNGLLAGVAVTTAVKSGQITTWHALAMLLPHGVLELPGLFLASALGLRVGIDFWRRIAKGEWRGLKQLFSDTIRLGAVVVLLLTAAALVEIYVSGSFAPKPGFFEKGVVVNARSYDHHG